MFDLSWLLPFFNLHTHTTHTRERNEGGGQWGNRDFKMKSQKRKVKNSDSYRTPLLQNKGEMRNQNKTTAWRGKRRLDCARAADRDLWTTSYSAVTISLPGISMAVSKFRTKIERNPAKMILIDSLSVHGLEASVCVPSSTQQQQQCQHEVAVFVTHLIRKVQAIVSV